MVHLLVVRWSHCQLLPDWEAKCCSGWSERFFLTCRESGYRSSPAKPSLLSLLVLLCCWCHSQAVRLWRWSCEPPNTFLSATGGTWNPNPLVASFWCSKKLWCLEQFGFQNSVPSQTLWVGSRQCQWRAAPFFILGLGAQLFSIGTRNLLSLMYSRQRINLCWLDMGKSSHTVFCQLFGWCWTLLFLYLKKTWGLNMLQ